MGKQHQYRLELEWSGNTGEGTKNYRAFKRDYNIKIGNKPVIEGSSDPSFRGDPDRHNPEEMFVASISACHMLWYLHFCAVAGIVVTKYTDYAEGVMEEDAERGGFFKEVLLKPEVTITDVSREKEAVELHKKANSFCFIANSCNFPIAHSPIIKVEI